MLFNQENRSYFYDVTFMTELWVGLQREQLIYHQFRKQAADWQ